jgi:hypothetical protein
MAGQSGPRLLTEASGLCVLGALVALGCNPFGQRRVDDVSIVTAYFVHCDSSLSLGVCYGPRHNVSTEDFTVIISRQTVLRDNVHGFSDCLVFSPRHWVCLDDRRRPVEMREFEMRWAELDSAGQASVSKTEYKGFWRALLDL